MPRPCARGDARRDSATRARRCAACLGQRARGGRRVSASAAAVGGVSRPCARGSRHLSATGTSTNGDEPPLPKLTVFILFGVPKANCPTPCPVCAHTRARARVRHVRLRRPRRTQAAKRHAPRRVRAIARARACVRACDRARGFYIGTDLIRGGLRWVAARVDPRRAPARGCRREPFFGSRSLAQGRA